MGFRPRELNKVAGPAERRLGRTLASAGRPFIKPGMNMENVEVQLPLQKR